MLVPDELHAQLGYACEEMVVESAAHIACAVAGLATDVNSVPYVAGWALRDGGDASTTIRQAAELVDQLARRIEQAITDHGNHPQAAADAA